MDTENQEQPQPESEITKTTKAAFLSILQAAKALDLNVTQVAQGHMLTEGALQDSLNPLSGLHMSQQFGLNLTTPDQARTAFHDSLETKLSLAQLPPEIRAKFRTLEEELLAAPIDTAEESMAALDAYNKKSHILIEEVRGIPEMDAAMTYYAYNSSQIDKKRAELPSSEDAPKQ